MPQVYLKCTNCGREHSGDLVNARCEECNEPLEVTFELNVPADWFRRRREGNIFQRFAPFYHYFDPDPGLSLGEGQTSLSPANHIHREIGINKLLIKNETRNPTWTFKDRGSAGSVQNAVRLGYGALGALSSGNAGASVAAYGARAGLKTLVLLKHNVPREKIDALTIYGAKAFQVQGPYGHAYAEAQRAGGELGIYFSLSDEPFRVEGYKSLAFEMYEQTGGRPPDVVAMPVGSGGFCRGVIKGFEELLAAGFIEAMPLFVGAQSEGCSPTVDAFNEGRERVTYFENAQTLDHVLENPLPQSGAQIIRKFREHGFILTKVDNQAVLKAQLAYGREGIFAQPASCTALAGLARAVREGKVPAGATAAAVVSGSGLKYPPVLAEHGFSPIRTPLEDLTSTLASHL